MTTSRATIMGDVTRGVASPSPGAGIAVTREPGGSTLNRSRGTRTRAVTEGGIRAARAHPDRHDPFHFPEIAISSSGVDRPLSGQARGHRAGTVHYVLFVPRRGVRVLEPWS